MTRNEVKEMVEKVVRVEYIAEDGCAFYNEEECRRYEESALFTVSAKLKRLNHKWTSHFDLLEGNDDSELEIFDIQTSEDLENLKRYLYLKMSKNGASESSIKACFSSETRKDFVVDNITVGHEVLIFWAYDHDWVWVYKDGSLNGYFEWVKEKYLKIINPEEPESKGDE